jgi:hypothetical protein
MPSREVPPATADHVIGSFPRDALNAALASTHRAGFGPQTRVLDGVRGDAARQLERAGLRVVVGETPSADALLIVVTAPGRTGIVADLFARLGAESVAFAARRDVSASPRPKPALLTPDIRLGEDAGSAPEV